MKITFDPAAPGFAMVLVSGRKRRVSVPGKWIVFRERRRTAGIFPEDILFSSASIHECRAYISDAGARAVS
jgi:hypothetical protein